MSLSAWRAALCSAVSPAASTERRALDQCIESGLVQIGGGRSRIGPDRVRSGGRRNGVGMDRVSYIIPTPADQNPLAQSRRPMDMIVQGRSMSLFQASQQWSTRSVQDANTR